MFRGADGPLGPRLGDSYPDFVHGGNGLGDIDIQEPATDCETQAGAEAIVDDVLATGGTLSAAISLAQKANYQIQDILVLLDLPNLNTLKWNGAPIKSLITY